MYRNLKMIMAAKGVTGESIAKVLEIHRNTFYKKLEGESRFTIEEAQEISECFFPEYKLSYLFRREEGKDA